MEIKLTSQKILSIIPCNEKKGEKNRNIFYHSRKSIYSLIQMHDLMIISTSQNSSQDFQIRLQNGFETTGRKILV